MSFVLDTNIVTALMRGEEAVAARLERVGRRSVLVPEPVWAEISYGLERLPRSARRARLEGRVELLRDELGVAVWTRAVSSAFGALKASLEARGQRLDDFDLAIAGHALAIDAVLVTANVRHLGRIEELTVETWGA